MEPELYRALRVQDLKRVRDCLNDWGNKRRWIWWSHPGRTLTPLHVASKGSCTDILAELLRHPEIGRSINEATDKASITPLHVAAGSSTPSIVRLLLDAGADISFPSADRSTPFHIACSRGLPETCDELLRRGALLEARDAEERTPLVRAVSNGRANITKWLLSEGADPAAVDIFGNSALALGCRVPNLDTIKALLDGGASVTSEDSEGKTCIHFAALSGRTELVDMMLNSMARSGQRLRDGGGCILFGVVERNLLKVVELLSSSRGQELGVNINRRHAGKEGDTPLHAAVSRGQRPIVHELLARGADPNVKNDGGLGALHAACKAPDSMLIVRLLLRAKADPNAKDGATCAPIYHAFIQGNDDLVHFLLSRGASLYRMDYDQALRIACFYGMVQAVESLLWMEADPEVVSLNKKDRGAEFHIRVCQTVRDGIRMLMAEALQEDGYEGSPSAEDERAKVVTAAKAAAKAWLLEGETAGKGLSETSSSTSAETASTSTTAVARQWSVNSGSMSSDSDGRANNSKGRGRGRGRGRGCDSETSSSGTSSVSSSVENSMDYEGHSSRSGDSASNSNPESDEEDDAFVVPVLDSLDQELDICRTPPRSPVDVSAAQKRRWTERDRESARIKANDSPKANRENPTTLGAVKDRARATLVGVIKWATSPRNSRSPKNSRGARSPPRTPPRGRSPIMGRGVVVGA